MMLRGAFALTHPDDANLRHELRVMHRRFQELLSEYHNDGFESE
jgi:hypothetical protein